jgi:hypothetical protein
LPGWTDDDVAGSPWCIREYEPDPAIGGWAGLMPPGSSCGRAARG